MQVDRNTILTIGVVAAAGLLWVLFSRNADVAIDVVYGANKARIEAKGGAIDHEKVMEAMFNNAFVRGAVEKWLAEKHSFASVADERLAMLIERNACSPAASDSLESRVKMLKDCAETPRNSMLRDLALRRRAQPFHSTPARTQLSIPETRGDTPGVGDASICDRDLIGRRIEVYNPKNTKSVFVTPTAHIPCSGIGEQGTQLYLNPRDATRLFGGPQPRGVQVVYVMSAQ